MTPASIVVTHFGGVRATARKLGVNPSTVCRWGKSKEEGGTGGSVPQDYFRPILALLGEKISLQELCFGKD